MPYLAPEAPIPITSCAPRLAEMKANPQIQAGKERPAWKKSLLVFMNRLSAKPMPSTKTKYRSMMSQSISVRFTVLCLILPQMSLAFVRQCTWMDAQCSRQFSADDFPCWYACGQKLWVNVYGFIAD